MSGVSENAYYRLFESRPGIQGSDTPALIDALRVAGGHVTHRVVTYRELMAAVDRVAAGLLASGVRPGDRVLLLVPMCVELYEAVLAVLKMGAVGLFIDPGDGLANLQRTAARMEPAAMLGTPRAQLLRLASAALRRIPLHVSTGRGWPCWTTGWRELEARGASGTRTAAVSATDPAMIAFTSGSTGVPKGVCRTHQDLLALFAMLCNHEAKQTTGVDFCAFPALPLDDLAAGRTSVLPCFAPGRSAARWGAALAAQLEQFPPLLLSVPPGILRVLVDHCRQTDRRFPSVRHVFTGGGVTPIPLVRDVAAVFPLAQFRILYGSTEAEPVTLLEADELLSETARLTEDGAGLCAGAPVPGVRVAIVEPRDGPLEDLVAVQGIGEVAVSGPHVNRGYFRDAAMTRRHKIVEAATGTVWHRMGDLGYLDAKGRLWLVGRVGQVVDTPSGPLHPGQLEPVFDGLRGVAKTALIPVEVPRSHSTCGQVAALLVQARSGFDEGAVVDRVRAEVARRNLPLAAVLACPAVRYDRRIGAKVQYRDLAARHGDRVREVLGIPRVSWLGRLLGRGPGGA